MFNVCTPWSIGKSSRCCNAVTCEQTRKLSTVNLLGPWTSLHLSCLHATKAFFAKHPFIFQYDYHSFKKHETWLWIGKLYISKARLKRKPRKKQICKSFMENSECSQLTIYTWFRWNEAHIAWCETHSLMRRVFFSLSISIASCFLSLLFFLWKDEVNLLIDVSQHNITHWVTDKWLCCGFDAIFEIARKYSIQTLKSFHSPKNWITLFN